MQIYSKSIGEIVSKWVAEALIVYMILGVRP